MLVGEDDVDLAEAGGGAAVADGVDLGGFAFGVAGGAVLTPVGGAGGGVAGLPEVGGAGLVGDAGEHAAFFPAFDFPEGVAAELEVVAPLIDAVGPVAFDVDAPLVPFRSASRT